MGPGFESQRDHFKKTSDFSEVFFYAFFYESSLKAPFYIKELTNDSRHSHNQNKLAYAPHDSTITIPWIELEW